MKLKNYIIYPILCSSLACSIPLAKKYNYSKEAEFFLIKGKSLEEDIYEEQITLNSIYNACKKADKNKNNFISVEEALNYYAKEYWEKKILMKKR